MELAGLEIFDELPKEDKKRTGKKQELMEQMYTVAAMEERYFDNAIGTYTLSRSLTLCVLTMHRWQ